LIWGKKDGLRLLFHGHAPHPKMLLWLTVLDAVVSLSCCLQAGGATLQQELDPLNREQEEINRRRQMLYFRTETGISPGQDMDRCTPLQPASPVSRHFI
jgi:hypothetical protein